MAVTQVQVLLAVLDTAHSASLAQVLMQAGATVSLVQVRSTEHLLEQLRERTPNLLVLELDHDGSLLEQVRARHFEQRRDSRSLFDVCTTGQTP